METNSDKTMDERAEHYYATLTRPLADEQCLVVTAYVIGSMDQQRIERTIANQQLTEKDKEIRGLKNFINALDKAHQTACDQIQKLRIELTKKE